MVSAYPGENGTLCSVNARDLFLEALYAQLKLKILRRNIEPATLEDAFGVATWLEAVCRTADDEYVHEVKKEKKVLEGQRRPQRSRMYKRRKK